MSLPDFKQKFTAEGFTLIELMIALAIFSIAALAVLTHTNQIVNQQRRLEEKTLALWLAENALAEIRLSHRWPDPAISNYSIHSAQRDWLIRTEITESANLSLRKILVDVKRQEMDSSIVSLTGYIGEH